MDPATTLPAESSGALHFLSALLELTGNQQQDPLAQIERGLRLGARLMGAQAAAVVNTQTLRPTIVHFHALDQNGALDLMEAMQASCDALQPRLAALGSNGGQADVPSSGFCYVALRVGGDYYGILCFQAQPGRALLPAEGIDGTVLLQLADWMGQLLEMQRRGIEQVAGSEIHLRILELAQEGIVSVDPQENISFANPAFCRMSGFSARELLGRSVLELVDEESRSEILRGTEQRRRGESSTYTLRLRSGGDGWRDLQIQASPLFNARGEYEGAVAIAQDVTESRVIDRALRTIASELAGVSGQQFHETLCAALASQLGVDAAFLATYELEPAGEVASLAVQLDGQTVPGFRFAAANSFLGKALAKRQPMLVAHAAGLQLSPAWSIGQLAIEAWAAQPLLSPGGAALGVIVVLSRRPFDNPALVEQVLRLYHICAVAEVQRENSEKRLRESEERYRSLLEDSNLAFAIWQNRHFIYVNPAFAELLGYDRSEHLIGKSVEEYVHPDDWAVMHERYERRLRGEYVESRIEVRLVRRDGRVRWVELNTALRSYHDAPAIQSTASDIHERRLAEEAVRASEERYRRLVEDMTEGIIVIDREGCFLFANPSAEQIFGVEAGTLQGQRLRDFLDEEQRERAGQQRARRKPGDQSHYMLRLTRPDGSMREVVVRSSSQYNKRGEYTGAFAIVQDITEQAQIERELQATAERYSDLVESSSDIIIQLDGEWKLRFANHAAEEVFGLPAVDLLERRALDFVPQEDREALIAKGREWVSQSRDNVSFESRIASVEGGIRHVLWAVHFKRNDRGELLGANCIGHDISGQQELQQQLLNQQKEESMTTLAGGIAHDFNNILMGVLGSASLLREGLGEGSTNADICDAIITSAKRMSDLTGKLLAYARGGIYQPQPVIANDTVRDCLAMLRGSIPAHITVTQDIDAALWPVEADPGQLNQVLLNLCVNACEAMGENGGTLSLSTSNVTLERNWHCPAHGEHPAGDYVLIKVSDTGSGMDSATLARIFEPFFSTKFQGRGLGLAATMGIIRHHHGCITAESSPGVGTTFHVLLPRGSRAPAEAVPLTHSNRFGGESILVVDDEPVVLQTAQRMLERQGYRVLTAASGRDALLVLAQEGDLVDVMLVDMHMPTMGGSELLKRLPGGTQRLRVLASSGYGADYALEGVEPERVHGFLQKPYTKTELLHSVRQVLDGKPV